MFHHIHTHTEFSTLDGLCSVSKLIKKAKSFGYKKLSITDHGNINGGARFLSGCQKEGIQGILGCEFYMVEDAAIRKQKEKRRHIILLAMNDAGYRSICRLIHFSNVHGFFYKPRIDKKVLEQNCEGLICTTACASGLISQENNYTLSLQDLEFFKGNFRGNFFLEMMPIDLPEQRRVNASVWENYKSWCCKPFVSNDVHFLEKGDVLTHEVLLCIGAKTTMDDPNRFKFSVTTNFFSSEEETLSLMRENMKELNLTKKDELFLLNNTEYILNLCEPYCFQKKQYFPEIPFLREGYKSAAHRLTIETKNELIKRGLDKDPEYVERWKEEMRQIISKKFEDYFLLVQDIINFARSRGILVGPGRGSSAGSLVCFLLGITKVDPIKFKTLFFRFIDPSRSDSPDIDIDFQDDRRQEVKQYITERYGEEYVANLGTFGTLKGKLVLRDLARVYKIPLVELNKVLPYILQRSSADARASFTVEDAFTQFRECIKFKEKYPHIIKMAIELEGIVKQYGIGAAGVIIANKPLKDITPIERRGKDKSLCCGYDWRDLKFVKILKMDILGLNFLSIINRTLSTLAKKGIVIDLEQIDLEDKKVYEHLHENGSVGIFQLETSVMEKVANAIHIENFDEFVACNALVRPGPFRSGSTQSYIKKKKNPKLITFLHPILKDITEETKGEILYQEQVMQLVRRIGNFDWKDTNVIRVAMSKSEGVEMMTKFMHKFIKGAMANGFTEELAIKIWTETSYYGAWSFNKSHAVAYTMLSFWCAYLRTYHFEEYMLSFINLAPGGRQVQGAKEMVRHGYQLLPPTVAQYDAEFEVIGDKQVVIGTKFLKSFGENAIEELQRCKPFKGELWKQNLDKRKVNSAKLRILEDIGFMDSSRGEDLNVFFNSDGADVILKQKRDEALSEHLPILFCTDVLQPYRQFMEKEFGDIKFTTLEEIDTSWESKQKGNWVLMAGVMEKINLKNKLFSDKTKEQDFGRQDIEAEAKYRFCVSDFWDNTGYLRISFYPDVYRKYEKEIWEGKKKSPIIFLGRIGPDRIYVRKFINLKLLMNGQIHPDAKRFLEFLKSGETVETQIALAEDLLKKGTGVFTLEGFSENGYNTQCALTTKTLFIEIEGTCPPGVVHSGNVKEGERIACRFRKGRKQTQIHFDSFTRLDGIKKSVLC